MTKPRPAPTAARHTVLQDGRAKAYRPMPVADRLAALAAGLAAYDRGDFFLAHELLEPAWMGTDDLGERAVLQGLIKLAAAFVHAARGNPVGIGKNLRGSADRLSTAGAIEAGRDLGIDVASLRNGIAERLAATDQATKDKSEAPLMAIPIPHLR